MIIMNNENKDLISRSQLYGIESLLMTDIVENNPTAKFVLEQVLYDIEHIEAADATKVVRSRWILNDDGSGTCRHCNRTSLYVLDMDNWLNFCPNCGADMRERKEE